MNFEIMVVDDDDDELLLTKYWLERRSTQIKVSAFLDANDATEELRRRVADGEQPPQLVTVDINMPRYDGISVAASLAPFVDAHMTAVGILTGSINPADRAAALRVGARFYAIKPMDATCLDDIGRQLGAFRVVREHGRIRVERSATWRRAEEARQQAAAGQSDARPAR